MDAIQEGDNVSEVIDGRCIGCGLCVSVCPVEAIPSRPSRVWMHPQGHAGHDEQDRRRARRSLTRALETSNADREDSKPVRAESEG